MRYVLLMWLALFPAIAGAQTAVTGMARAAGMPLNDGGLPPGMLIVRVVRGGFSNNAADQTVTVVSGGATKTGQTGNDGRAEFMHLEPGSQVRVSARVDGQPLESDPFAMPAESGVRVLLVAPGNDSGEAVAVGPVTLPPPSMAQAGDLAGGTAVASPPPPPSTAAQRGGDGTVLIIKTVLTCCTLFALGVFLKGRRPQVPVRSSKISA